MNSLNKLPMALTMLGLGAASSFGEIKVNDNLSVSGFLDMSAVYDDGSEALTASFDQLELDFMVTFGGGISARADVNAHPGTTNLHLNSSTGMALDLEQGFINYSAGGAGVTVGRFLSVSGFEAAEPTGLYQYSVSKNLNGKAGPVYGGYQNGLGLNYGTDKFGIYGSVVNSVWDVTDTDLESPGLEAQVSVMPVEGVTAKVAYLFETDLVDRDEDGIPIDTTNQQLVNAWAQYAVGAITAAAEFNYLMDWGAADLTGLGWLAMVNYKITDRFAATVRYSAISLDDEVSATDDMDGEVTFSPSFAISANWLALAEVKRQLDAEVTSFAVESLFTF